MTLIIKAPNEVYSLQNSKNLKIFLGGGITNCPDWQSFVCSELADEENLTIYNPRRDEYVEKYEEIEKQIIWENDKLAKVEIIFMWFSRGSDNPIALYELGMWVNSRNDVIPIVGIDPQYNRKMDVEIQTKLVYPNITIHDSLVDMISAVRGYAEMKKDLEE